MLPFSKVSMKAKQRYPISEFLNGVILQPWGLICGQKIVHFGTFKCLPQQQTIQYYGLVGSSDVMRERIYKIHGTGEQHSIRKSSWRLCRQRQERGSFWHHIFSREVDGIGPRNVPLDASGSGRMQGSTSMKTKAASARKSPPILSDHQRDA